MVSPDQAFQVLLEVTRVLEELDVPYVVGGSLASSLHGIPRSTQDADLVAALPALVRMHLLLARGRSALT